MGAHDSPITAIVGPDTSTYTRLRGPWLWAARAVWVAGFITLAAMYTLGFLAVHEVLSTVCTHEPCTLRQQIRHTDTGDEVIGWPGPSYGFADPLRTDQVEALEKLGLTLDQYGWLGALQMGIPILVYLLIGAALFWRKSDDWMVLFASVMSLTSPLGSLPLPFTLMVRQPAWEWVFVPANVVAVSTVLIFPLIFPTGRFVLRWTRWLALAEVVGGIIVILQRNVAMQYPGEPIGNVVYIGVSFIAGAYALVYRYFRIAGPAERQQIKWVVIGLVAFVGMQFILIPLDAILVPTIAGSNIALRLALSAIPDTLGQIVSLFIPVSIAIAVFRYRLWDIDFVINRGLVYGGLTVVLLGCFGISLFIISQLFRDFAGGPLVAVAVSAGVFGLVFNPTQRWLRTFVDRRFYGIQVDYRKTSTPTPSPVASSGVLRTTLGAYDNLEPIGRGGMAEIYKARHPTLDKTVAIKVLPPALAREADFRRRFEREAKVVAGLKHPNIVQVFDFGESEGTYYMVMEYIGGRDLGDVIRETAPLPLGRVQSIVEDIAGALDYAHSQGLVHRDVKPSNVMLEAITSTGPRERSERAVLMDFGIARILTGGTRLTATGMMGTFDYIAPEQIQAAANVDGRADIYSLGVMVYQMLSGRLPFEGGHPAALLIAHLNQPPPDPREMVSDVPESTARAVMRAMAKKSDQRFNSAGEFVLALA